MDSVDYAPLENYFIYRCLDVPASSCVTLRLRDRNSGTTQQERISLVWNDKIIKKKYQLSPNQNEENIKLCNNKCPEQSTYTHITFKTDVYPSEFSWNIIDLNSTIKYSGGNYTQPFTDYEMAFCVPDVDTECLTFQAFDSAKNGGTLYQLEQGFNNDVFHYGNANKQVTKVPFPKNKCGCPQGQSLFELDLFIRDRSIQFSWDLVTTNASIITSGSQYINWESGYKHRECLPVVNASECVALSFFVHGSYKAVDYSVRWDGNLIRKSETAKKLRDMVVINGNCGSVPICAEGYRSIKIVMYTIDCQKNPSCPFAWDRVESYPEPFSWEIVDHQNKTVMNGGKNTFEKQRFYHYRKCVPSAACLSFRFLESSYDGGVIVNYYWDNNYTNKITKISYNDDKYQVPLGECSKS